MKIEIDEKWSEIRKLSKVCMVLVACLVISLFYNAKSLFQLMEAKDNIEIIVNESVQECLKKSSVIVSDSKDDLIKWYCEETNISDEDIGSDILFQIIIKQPYVFEKNDKYYVLSQLMDLYKGDMKDVNDILKTIDYNN